MAETARINAKTQESKQKCSNSCKQKPKLHSSGFFVDRMLQLQRTAGNQAVQRLFKSRALQAKLKIGQPSDQYEQEANRVAEQVMKMPGPVLQRKCATCDEGEERILQAKELPGKVSVTQGQDVPHLVQDVLRSPGQPLDPKTRSFMEASFGYDFSRVRVHFDTAAERSAQDVNANAYTVGHNIVFGSGRFAPGTHEGRKLIAHELTHVVQQSGANGISSGQRNENTNLLPISTLNNGIQLQRFISSEPAGGCGICYGIPANAGKAAHSLIQTEFEVLYPLGLVELGVQSADDDNGRLDLAIAVPGGFEIGEIKPANAQGYEDGITQIAKYIGLIGTKFPNATIKPLTKILPPIIFPTLSSDCPVQILFVNPPVGGVYGYFCEPSYAQLRRKCSCPAPRKKQEEGEKEKKEQKKQQTKNIQDQKLAPKQSRDSNIRAIVEFVKQLIEMKIKDYDAATKDFLNKHPEVAAFIFAAGFTAVLVLLADDLTIAGIADDVAIPPILIALWRAAKAF